MTEQIRIDWYVKHQHTKTFTPEQFAAWAGDAFPDLDDPADLDAVYEKLDDRDWRAIEALADIATDGTFLDVSDVEVIDLTERESSS